ncbi:MAG: hypothetical protein COU08_04650 [Candidatus Harrisonbacteria bacterium CG10_big_fil_rev_8_21_14_0_10_42_17]|uniref:Uncharacterized protein n=1 Tax=Candidatus Harrisonbacteria bacterium CG10_big_fil_rev_8_21_14_0_10_42_17 TaxID=1974584 RepID=A0A2M6WH41_9BACT|nr:MAG: hypothetical protein COU08_04650 [Candidatus Harrisonbacteria bacterium CG10_big_fil_rev_8_21_14_0_10_42_17]
MATKRKRSTSKKNSEKNHHTDLKLAVLAGIAGYYLLAGERGKKHRAALKSWSMRMKADVMEKLETASSVSKKHFHTIVDDVAKHYKTAKHVDKQDLKDLVTDLKQRWREIEQEASTSKQNKKPRS